MGRVGLIMAGLALVTIALSSLIPVIGQIVLAPLTALLIGAGAGWWASKALGYGTAGRGAGAGAIAGLGALLGSIIGLALLAGFAGSTPEFQQGIQETLRNAGEQNPGAELPETISGGAVGAVGGLVGGCFGLFYLFLSVIGGLIAGLFYGRNRQPAATMSADGYSTTNTSLPQMTSTPPLNQEHASRVYNEPDPAGSPLPTNPPDYNTRSLEEPGSEGGARVYPDNQRRD